MISKKEIKSLLSREPYFEDMVCSMQAGPRLPKGIINESKKTLAYIRKFNNEIVRPHSLKADREHQENPELLPYELIEEANKWGFYTMFLPKAIGGKGFNLAGSAWCAIIKASSHACVHSALHCH